MMSACRWRERRALWHALVFWCWLASFVFGFAASDLFHTANCPEELALRASARPVDSASARAQLAPAHPLQLDASCPTCLLQLSAQGVLGAALTLAVPFAAALLLRRLRAAHAVFRPLPGGARGPPLWFVPSLLA